MGLRDDEVVRIRPRAVRDDGDVVRGGHRAHLEELGQAAEPHDVGLEDVDRPVLDQLAEAVLGVLVLARRPLDRRHGLLEQPVAVKVVRVQALLPPVDVDLLVDAPLGELDRVRHVERHVAVDHEREAGVGGKSWAEGSARGPDEGEVTARTHSGPTLSLCLRRNSMFLRMPTWPSAGENGSGTLAPQKPIFLTCGAERARRARGSQRRRATQRTRQQGEERRTSGGVGPVQ